MVYKKDGKRYGEMLWPSRLETGERIQNEKGLVEIISGIEIDGDKKYVSTIHSEDHRYENLRTYLVGEDIEMTNEEKRYKTKKKVERVSLENIESFEKGLYDFQLN